MFKYNYYAQSNTDILSSNKKKYNKLVIINNLSI